MPKEVSRAGAKQMFLINSELFEISQLKAIWSKSPQKEKNRPVVMSSGDIFNVVHPFYPEIDLYESFWVLLLSRGNRIKGLCNISVGSVAGTVADPKKIFQHALLSNSSSIVLMHNHPSGNATPSLKDIEITRKCKTVGVSLDLPVIDHIILTPFDTYYSFADNQML